MKRPWIWMDRKCPECGGELDYEPIQRETRTDPGYPERLFCNDCGEESDDYDRHMAFVPREDS